MRHKTRRWALGGFVGLAALAGLTPAARAAITPTASTSTPTPLQAGATGNLNLNLAFAPTAGDSPQALTIKLPPGFLADAAVDGGACLTGAPQIGPGSPCQIGSGVILATLDGFVPISTNVNFYLVAPPAAGDLAGLAVGPGDGSQIGATGPITIRPSGDPDGVGVTIALTLPDSQAGAPLSISDVDSTFTGLRFPASCPATAAAVSVSADSYQDPSPQTTSLPLSVSGCASLPYAPKFSATVSRQGKTAKVTTIITQAANETPNATVELALPDRQLRPALSGLARLCRTTDVSTCKPVASVTAVSPDYPAPLRGRGYLTGSLSALKLQLSFPAPFPLTLVGAIDLHTNVTTFTGLPDFPLTSLTVTLPGGGHGLFRGNCTHRRGTASATTTDQNGDRTAKASDRFTIAGCASTVSGHAPGHTHSKQR